MSAGVAGTTLSAFRPNPTYTTLRDVTATARSLAVRALRVERWAEQLLWTPKPSALNLPRLAEIGYSVIWLATRSRASSLNLTTFRIGMALRERAGRRGAQVSCGGCFAFAARSRVS
jgi:hypothetical protein